MTDIASLGLKIDSSQVDPATQKLDRLSNAAKRAQAASDGVGVSTKNAGKVVKAANSNWETYDETVARLGIKTKQTAAATKVATAAVNGQAVAVTNAAKRADVATRSYGAFAAALRTVGTIIGGFVMNAVIVAIGVLLAELGKLVDWSGLAASALYGLANAIEIIAPYVAAAAGTLALIYAPAILSGIAAVTVAVATLGATALRAAAAFTIAWLAAMGPAGWFILGLAAITAAAIIFRDELTRILGFDIVAAAKDGVNTIIAIFHGGYDGIVAAWANLPAAMGDLSIRAGNAFLEGLRRMIQKAVTEINAFIKGLAQTFAGTPLEGLAKSIPTIDNSGGSDGPFRRSAWQMDNPYAGAASGAVDAAKAGFASGQGTDYVGQIGEAVGSMASSAAAKLRELAGSFGGVEGAAGKAGGAAKGAAEKAIDPWKGLRKAVDTVSDGMKFARDVVGGFVSDLRAGLKNGESFWESFKNAASKAIDKIVDKLLNNMLDAIFQVGSATGGGGGGFLGGLFSFLGFANGGVFQGGQVTPFARGGVVSRPTLFPMANGAGLMGEAGPEAIMPLRRGPDGRLGVSAANGNAQPQKLHVTVGVSVDDDGKIKAYVTDMGQQAAKAGAQLGVRQVSKSLPSMIANAQSRSM